MPSVGVSRHVAGKSAVVLPAHSSHSPQSLLHWVVLVQRGHAFASPAFATEHVELNVTSTVVPPANSTVQQPKQSQPFGVSGRQKSMQALVKAQSGSVAGSFPVKQSVL